MVRSSVHLDGYRIQCYYSLKMHTTSTKFNGTTHKSRLLNCFMTTSLGKIMGGDLGETRGESPQKISGGPGLCIRSPNILRSRPILLLLLQSTNGLKKVSRKRGLWSRKLSYIRLYQISDNRDREKTDKRVDD